MPRGAEFLNEVCETFKDFGGISSSQIWSDRLTFLIRNDTLYIMWKAPTRVRWISQMYDVRNKRVPTWGWVPSSLSRLFLSRCCERVSDDNDRVVFFNS